MLHVLAWIVDLPPILSSKWWAAALALALAASVLAMTAASFTRWGRKKPLTKCIVATVIAHLWLLMYALSTNMSPTGIGSGGDGDSIGLPSPLALEMAAAFEDAQPAAGSSEAQPDRMPQLWNMPLPVELPLPETPDINSSALSGETQAQPLAVVSPAASEDQSPSAVDLLTEALSEAIAESLDSREMLAESTAALSLKDDSQLSELLEPNNDDLDSVDDKQLTAEAHARPLDQAIAEQMPTPPQPALPPAVQHVADRYRLRFSPDRLTQATAAGGDAATEAAVQSALAYLAAQQLPSGLFSSANSGGGRETYTLGENRGGAGGKADAAITGLAALAFMGAGHVPSYGQYAGQCAAAIDALIRGQSSDGCLAGVRQIGSSADVRYAKMYSHAIALLALAECEAFIDDGRLHEAVARGVYYTLAAQNPRTGGWRYDAYVTGDPGDLSLYGWQAMALYSAAERHPAAAAALPRTYEFLARVAAGRHGGLAVYRPVPGQLPTASMTAEALACRRLFGLSVTESAAQEAAQTLLAAPPGIGQDNLYYWYYATLGMKFGGGPAWEEWNNAVKRQLLATQTDRGPAAGSWSPDGMWGGYGGRIYSTAMGALILEVYYRYLPIYRGSAPDIRLTDRYTR